MPMLSLRKQNLGSRILKVILRVTGAIELFILFFRVNLGRVQWFDDLILLSPHPFPYVFIYQSSNLSVTKIFAERTIPAFPKVCE